MKHFAIYLSALLVANSVTLSADTLILRDGKAIQGTFLGGSVRQIDFLASPSGESLHVPVSHVMSLTFTSPLSTTATPQPAPAPVASQAATASRQAMMVPAGTTIRVRTIDAIDAKSTQSGAQFRAAIDDPIMSGGVVVVPRGADVVLVA